MAGDRSILSGLNAEQREAVLNIQGPQLILAGAGSGKTRVITHRIAYMLERGIPARSIVAVTFTNKAAREMKARLSSMLTRAKMRGMVISTFHSLGNRILQQEIERLGYRLPFSIYTPDDLHNVLADIYRELKLDPARIKEDNILGLISLFKNQNRSAHDFIESRSPEWNADLFHELTDRYAKSLHDLNAVDFDDLIQLPTRIFQKDADLLGRYLKRWKYFLVDEFQDTNPAQYDFLRLLVRPANNVCVVGDDDQSIYGWRGADLNIILNFAREFSGTRTVKLETNYRSTARILHAANTVIANNANRMGKRMRYVHGDGPPLRGVIGADEMREATIVADIIQREVIANRRSPGDFAILFRTNFQSRAFEQELRVRNIPNHVVGGYRFFDRREVRDMIAYLRVLANPRDEIALLRIINRPRRGIGEGSIKKIMHYIMSLPDERRPDLHNIIENLMAEPGLVPGLRSDAVNALYEFMELLQNYRTKFAQAGKLAPVLAQLIADLKFEHEFLREGDNPNVARARLLNLSELVNMLSFMEENNEESSNPTLFDFLGRLSLMASDQEEDSPRGRVQLLTLHLSKGLEFPVVFLAGMEEGLFPAPRSLEENGAQDAALSEERRLFYVGITRACEELWLTGAASRRKFGETQTVEPSRFLDELPTELLEWYLREDGSADGGTQNTLTDLMDGLKMLSV
ncbi:MAG: UvrD-helicase domain-containing protein [Leptospiraceae bacterium]|nr:UvrD-helicase domain-containing protein [Leptospiraceae bacterium]